MKNVTFKNKAINLFANLFFPEGFSEAKQYPVVICGHPVGGVKEQTAGLYAKKIAELGYVTLAMDAGYQGESSGEPRYLEDPYARVDDFSAAINYLNTLKYVDADKIAILGVCGAGGYVVNAAIIDHRIKAIIGISAVNVGDMFRKGWLGTDDNVGTQLTTLTTMATELTLEAMGGEIKYIPWAPYKKEDTPYDDLKEACEYYRTERATHENSPSKGRLTSIAKLMSYDAFNFADRFLTQPILMIVGDQAGSQWNGEKIIQQAASKEKELFVIKGVGHVGLYDKEAYVSQAINKIKLFLEKNL